jgi:hypothetical protein
VTGDSDSGDSGSSPEPPWHERTSTLVGASAGALAAIAILYFLISTMITEFSDPEPVRQYFIEPSGTTSRTSTATTTTQTITSTRAPVTTDINPGDQTTTSGTETSGSETSGSETTSSSETSESPSTTRSPSPTRTTENGETSRQRPRLNETRTLYPRP